MAEKVKAKKTKAPSKKASSKSRSGELGGIRDEVFCPQPPEKIEKTQKIVVRSAQSQSDDGSNRSAIIPEAEQNQDLGSDGETLTSSAEQALFQSTSSLGQSKNQAAKYIINKEEKYNI
jgi:hypothetical protein